MKPFYDMILRAPETGAGNGGDPAAAAAAATAAAATAAAAAAATSWVPVGTDPDLMGHIQNRQWDKKPAAVVALEAARAHRESEKFLGVPQDRLLKLPAVNADPKEWDPIYQRLGAPKDAKEYDTALAGVKFTDGSAIDDKMAGVIKSFAATNHLSATATAALAKELVKATESDEGTDGAVNQNDLALSDKRLRENWGVNYEPFKLVAFRAAEKLGPDFKQAAQDLEKSVGYDRVMEIFRMLGASMGEDTFARNPGPNGGNVITKEQAGAKLADLKRDKEWVAKHLSGDFNARREHDSLLAISLGQFAV